MISYLLSSVTELKREAFKDFLWAAGDIKLQVVVFQEDFFLNKKTPVPALQFVA